jgi:hypothetical protein
MSSEKQDSGFWARLLPWFTQGVLIMMALGASWQSLHGSVQTIEKNQMSLRMEVLQVISDNKADMLALIAANKAVTDKDIQALKDSGSPLAIRDHDRIVVLEETYKILTSSIKQLEGSITTNFQDVKTKLDNHIAEKKS